MIPLIRLHPSDTVAIAACDLPAGKTVDGIAILEAISKGHKVCISAVLCGAPVLKFGQVIGLAAMDIAVGEHVHVHNLTIPMDSSRNVERTPKELQPLNMVHRFEGYKRRNGSVGTRNHVGIITTVNCSATVAKQIQKRVETRLGEFPNVDGVVALTHQTGCGMSAEGQGMSLLRRTLGGFAKHPNFCGVLLIGLGCEANQLANFASEQGLAENESLRFLEIQSAGGTLAAIEQGAEHVVELLKVANRARRSPQPASELKLGLQCGGSDGWSGITANPSLGAASDLLVRAGGTVILAETPEIYGAEALLLRRAESGKVAQSLIDKLEWWENYVRVNDQELNNNPSPGNIAGGLSTILEKSLGAVAKAGTAPLRGVRDYAETVDGPGLFLMDSPGYDPCSVTGEIASGANLICFTTGRGSVFGSKPVPSLKIASNEELWKELEPDIDISAAQVADGSATPGDVGERIFQLMLETASWKRSKSEELGFGDMEFVPWQIGAVV